MADSSDDDRVFATAAMAEILLSQNLLDQARQVVDELGETEPENPRIPELKRRIEELAHRSGHDTAVLEPIGRDSISLELSDGALRVYWELTEKGLGLARHKAKYSGVPIVRLFTASVGPRGVRTGSRDHEIDKLCARRDFYGMPRPATHVAAVGFLANTGEFVPMARSDVLTVGKCD